MKILKYFILIIILIYTASIAAQTNIPKFNEKTEYGWVLIFEGELRGDWDSEDKEFYDGIKLIFWFERKDRKELNMTKFIWEFVNLNNGKRERWEQEVFKTDKMIYDKFELTKGHYICLVIDTDSGIVIGRSLEFMVK